MYRISMNMNTCPNKYHGTVESVINVDSVKMEHRQKWPTQPRRRAGLKYVFSNKIKSKTIEKWTPTENINLPEHRQDTLAEQEFRSKSAEDALEVIENRRTSIKAKLLVRNEHLLTQDEEQDIRMRADLYAIATIPETKYFILPSDDTLPRILLQCEDAREHCTCLPVRKKKRRNYGNTDCYVTQHSTDDIFDNTKSLPIGTRLVKPPTKLVEIVSQAISGSPDGLLQVQHIYSFLQNKYPFFRYIDRVAINSWRSSIRHALYQKWFRKIRVDFNFISYKGCYWAINSTCNPKEWSLAGDNSRHLDAAEKQVYVDVVQDVTHKQETNGVATVAQQILSTEPSHSDEDDGAQQHACSPRDQHSSSPINEPDPILATYTADWNTEDIYMSSNDTGQGTMMPISPLLPSVLYLSQESQDCTIRTDLLFGTPLNSPCGSAKGIFSMKEMFSPKSKNSPLECQKLAKTDISPMVNWTPNWDEYGSYIVSPQRYFQNLPGEKGMDCNIYSGTSSDNTVEDVGRLELKTGCCLLSESVYSSPEQRCGYESDTESCEFEIIADFPTSNFSSPDLGLGFDS